MREALPRCATPALLLGFFLLPSFPSAQTGSAEPPRERQEAGISPGLVPEADLEPAHPYGLRQIGLDARYLVTRPAGLDRSGWIKMALTVGTTGVLYLYREEIRDWVQDHRDPEREEFLDQVRVMGKGAFAPSLSLIAYGASFITRSPREKETAVLLLESMGFSALGVGIGQSVIATQRPYDGTDVDFFARRGHGVSGDAALAASVVPVLSRQYLTVYPGDRAGTRAWKVGAASLLYAGAFLTGYQRLDSDAHWAPDVFLGLVTGFTVGQMLCDSHQVTGEISPRRVGFSVGPGSLHATITF